MEMLSAAGSGGAHQLGTIHSASVTRIGSNWAWVVRTQS